MERTEHPDPGELAHRLRELAVPGRPRSERVEPGAEVRDQQADRGESEEDARDRESVERLLPVEEPVADERRDAVDRRQHHRPETTDHRRHEGQQPCDERPRRHGARRSRCRGGFARRGGRRGRRGRSGDGAPWRGVLLLRVLPAVRGLDRRAHGWILSNWPRKVFAKFSRLCPSSSMGRRHPVVENVGSGRCAPGSLRSL